MVSRGERRAMVEAVLLGFVVETPVVSNLVVILLCQLLIVTLVGAKRKRYCNTREGRVEVRIRCIIVDVVDGVFGTVVPVEMWSSWLVGATGSRGPPFAAALIVHGLVVVVGV